MNNLKHLLRFKQILIACSLLVLLSACGITGHRPSDPGYANYELPGWTEADRVMTISLGPAILRMARWAVDDEDEEKLQGLLEEVRAVRVAIYEMEGDNKRLRSRLKDTSQELQKKGWEVLVKVHEENEQTLVMSRMKNEVMTGIVVLVVDEEEMVFVNLMGNIDPARLGAILQELDDDTEADLDIDIPEDLESKSTHQAI